MKEPSLVQLYLLRACYLLMVVGIAWQFWPKLFGAVVTMPATESAAIAMLSILGLLSVAGLFAPLRMLPVMLVEIGWKVIWTLTVAVPRWQAGAMDPAIIGTLFACAFALPFIFITPWRYVFKTCFNHMDRWR